MVAAMTDVYDFDSLIEQLDALRDSIARAAEAGLFGSAEAVEPQLFDFGGGPVPAHRHANGGGWVADTAEVADTAYVGPDAWVYGSARVFGDARVSGDAWVSGSARVFGSARVSGSACVSGTAWVSGYASVSEGCRV